MIYFVQEGSAGPVKIGYVTNGCSQKATQSRLRSRLSGLQTGNPRGIRCLATMDGEEAQEALLHQRFKPSQIRGEWFRPTQEILDFIAAEGTPYTAPVIELVWADKSPAESTWIDELRHMFRNGVSA